MSGEISETAAMTTQGNVNADGPGMNDGVPPADAADQVADGQPKEYPAGIDVAPGGEGDADEAQLVTGP